MATERVIKTNLKGKKYQEIIDSMLGQVSDGIWENSPRAEHYWPFISVEMAGKEVVLVVSEKLWEHRISNAFVDMDDNKVKEWCANKIKAVIKEEGLAWKRDNEEETDYCSRHEGTTVSDCYYVYEVLKGRNVLKHTEYGIREAIQILETNGYTVILNEDFGCGVADCGADQGIPQSGDCKAVPMMRLGDPAPYGKIQKLKSHHEGAAPFWRRSDMTIGRIKKKKHKKKR